MHASARMSGACRSVQQGRPTPKGLWRRGGRNALPWSAAQPGPERPVPEAANSERHARIDQHHAAEASDTGHNLTGKTAKLPGMSEAQPAADFLPEAVPFVRTPLHEIAG